MGRQVQHKTNCGIFWGENMSKTLLIAEICCKKEKKAKKLKLKIKFNCCDPQPATPST